MAHKILRLPEVGNRIGLSKSSIYLRMSSGEFPKPVSLGGRAVGWLEQDVDNWLDEKIKASKSDEPCPSC